MIKLNNKDFSIEGDSSLDKLLEIAKNDSFNELVMKSPFMVIVNDKYISEEFYSSIVIKENDDVKLIPMLLGGITCVLVIAISFRGLQLKDNLQIRNGGVKNEKD